MLEAVSLQLAAEEVVLKHLSYVMPVTVDVDS